MEREYNNIYRGDGLRYLDFYKKNGVFVLTHLVDGVVENKSREIWTKDDKEKVKHNLKETLLSPPLLVLVSFYKLLIKVQVKVKKRLGWTH